MTILDPDGASDVDLFGSPVQLTDEQLAVALPGLGDYHLRKPPDGPPRICRICGDPVDKVYVEPIHPCCAVADPLWAARYLDDPDRYLPESWIT